MKASRLLIVALFASVSAQAASTGTLLLQGTVALVNDIVINAQSGATTLDIVGGETGKLVAVVDETSNNLNGYTIEMSSANSGLLVHTTDSSQSTSYTVSYDGGSSVTLSSTPQTVKNVSSLSGLTTVSSDVNVDVAANATAIAGTYQDTVTISIVAN